MKYYLRMCVLLLLCFLCHQSYAGDYIFAVKGDKTYLNGQEFLVKGLRCSNALISDRTTDELIANLDTFARYGVNTVSVFFMGSRFGDVKGYREDASLNPVYSKRMGRIIEAADKRGMVVLVGCLYWSTSKAKWESWTQTQANLAVANTVRWLKEHDYRNVFIDVDNEGMARSAKSFDNRKMVIAGKALDPTFVIATNFRGLPPPEADLGIHHSEKAAGKPYIESEATPSNAPGNYWGKYSKVDGYYNYINIGLYNEDMKASQIQKTNDHLSNGMGYMLAGTWLQCVPPYGPNNNPGGYGTKDDPGIRWWLDYLREYYGPYEPPQSRPKTVGRWERFETTLTNTKSYRDPYRDVTLAVTYTRPDGKKVEFWGFYDGRSRWIIRFMPDRPGLWRYEARFSDGAPGISGNFQCVESEIPGMISKDESNPLWFGYKGGKHLLMRSLHVGDRFFAANWPEKDRKRFLQWFQQQGYNMLSIASHYLNRDSEGRGKGWQTPDLWDEESQTPNPRQYQKTEAILDSLAARKILVFPFAGFFGRDSDYPANPADQSLYIKYTLARIASYWNLLFNLAGPEPRLKGRPFLNNDLDRLGAEIQQLDVFGHLLSVHNRTGDDEFKDKDYTNYGTLQGPKTLDRKKLSRDILRNHHPRKPLYAQETLWAGNKYHPKYTYDDLRKNAYVLMMSAAAINFADMDGNSSSGFSGTMDMVQKDQKCHDIIKNVWDFFETIPFWRLGPRQDLV
ncbi:MAG: DUF5060 domain-containing protein [Planctomycetes bacterium]|nr:DUF5060 domain-containing protein [Planctomycetota bacterium]MBL7144101.1 DUF5060 domain-containing protein [Phycisphaerae bacterium]